MSDEFDEQTVSLKVYSEALDEIWRLRRAFAYEAKCLEVHTSYARFPKSRRPIAEEQAERMREAARGNVEAAYAVCSPLSLRAEYFAATGKETLTRTEWEEEKWW